MRAPSAAGGFPAIWYTLKKGREAGGLLRLWKAMRTRNACKTCALGMGGQAGGMVNESGHFPEVCKKSLQAMVADMGGAITPEFWADHDFASLRSLSPRELESLGRIVHPLHAGPLDDRYRTISWSQAMDRLVEQLRKTPPERTFFYFSGRSSNEAAFLLQVFARLHGTNNVNNCSYYCHQASGVGLASVTGSGTATITLDDVDHADLLFLIGGNPASNHPRFMRSLMELKRRRGKVVVVNPMRELGLVRFKVPSDVRSLLFGTDIADEYLMPRIGGDIAVLAGIAKATMAIGAVAESFVTDHCDGWDAWRSWVEGLAWADLEAASGVTRAELERVAEMYAASERTIFAWTMGITHHEHGVENVQTIAGLAMLRGMLGRPGAGLLPLRGHSNVQGVGSVGVTPVLKPSILKALEARLGVELPKTPGLDTMACMEAAERGEIDLAVCLGGNLFGSNPDSAFASKALRNIPLVVQLSTTTNTGHCCGLGRETLVLPVRARDEESQATTQESMFNFVRISDGGPARHEGPRGEVDLVCELGERVLGTSGAGQGAVDWTAMRDHDAVRSLIAEVVPGYGAIAEVGATKREFTIDGRIFHDPTFPTESGRARFHVVEVPSSRLAPDELALMTVRSEGQFNTVVYEDEDLYRGQDRRDVILMHPEDMAARGLAADDPVEVSSNLGTMRVLARPFEIARGCAAMYYPEANILVPRTLDGASKTPAFKNVRVRVAAVG
jgi:molybdopterin-dependent oxidoreductase alpha subunit